MRSVPHATAADGIGTNSESVTADVTYRKDTHLAGGGALVTRTVFTFDTTHHALWAEEVAREAGIPAEVIPAPPAARARCNLALETLPEEVDTLASALAGQGVPFGRWTAEE